jgi:uncharacterized protein (DUF305 family)
MTDTAASGHAPVNGDGDASAPGWLSAHLGQLALGVAFVFLAGAGGHYLGTRRDAPPAAKSADVGFLQDMIAHHEQALQLSNDELLRGRDETAKTFAREILLFQSYDIGLMERQLQLWGYERGTQERAMGWMGRPAVPVDAMPGLASEDELDALADASGAHADALFIALMRDHHAGGVHMAEAAAARAEDPFVRELAGRMARNQRLEIREMAAARDRAGLPAHPPGFRPDAIPSPDARGGHGDHE